MADNIDEFLNKSEYRNAKSVLFSRRMPQTIAKSECHKFKTNANYYLDFMVFLKFGFLSFEFVCGLRLENSTNFDIRISEFPVSDKWIKCNHF